jgi:hypothetical protein
MQRVAHANTLGIIKMNDDFEIEELQRALMQAVEIFDASIMMSAGVKDDEQREVLYKTIASCAVAISAKVLFSLYREHDQSLEQFTKETRNAIGSLRKQHFAKKVMSGAANVH